MRRRGVIAPRLITDEVAGLRASVAGGERSAQDRAADVPLTAMFLVQRYVHFVCYTWFDGTVVLGADEVSRWV
jgi:hypothetical protein